MTSYGLFAGILDYPGHSIRDVTEQCAAELTEAPQARWHLLEFQRAVEAKSLAEFQEIYTSAFDLRTDCTPNLGYHLFGDDARRGVFLAELKTRMEACGLDLGTEIPDHWSLILKYLEKAPEERAPIIEDCLLPALPRIIEVLQNTKNPYEHALRALVGLLEHQREMMVAGAEVMDA
ncbi:MAG TPA: hypothetical protein VFL96_10080 [Acidobacteriaceae bacterium]|nr:hypothetical protein [Acidobacteriaceae bacterium]